MRSFVTADWLNLIVASYKAPKEMLQPHLPPGLSLDVYHDTAYISIVGFQFNRTRLLSMPLPAVAGLGSFPQWNFRTYVRSGNHLGVVFLKEYVPSPFTAAIVSAMYNEPYIAAPLTCRVTELNDIRRVRYDLKAAGQDHVLAVSGSVETEPLDPGTLSEFFLRQGSGCGMNSRGKAVHFVVEHSDWNVHPVREYAIDVDFGALYGDKWAEFTGRTPDSVLLCAGSTVRVSQSMLL